MNITSNICALVSCGNGVIENNEECDDNNRVLGDGCTYNCVKEPCNKLSQERRRGANKSEICVSINCGNGILENGEECDDTNTVSSDGCNLECKKELCPEN
jgi:cysteine-rich repeat protein